MSDIFDDDYNDRPIDYTKSPTSIGLQLQKKNQNQVQSVDAVPYEDDPFIGLKKDLVNFFSNRMTEIKSKDAIQQKIIQRLSDMIDEDNLQFDQLVAAYRLISSDSRSSTDSLLALFRPTPGVASPFAQNVTDKEDKQDVFDQVYNNMTDEDLRNVDMILKLLRVAQRNKDNEDE